MVESIRNLETLISHLLIFGVLTSIILISIGTGLWLIQAQELTLNLRSGWVLKGDDFFDALKVTLEILFSGSNPSYAFMAAGVLFLMLTQYLRVVMSAMYFFTIRDWKYVSMTLIVLGILTVTLLWGPRL